ncbi:MAG: pyruvate kinase [Desulfosarcinaceae bacterium]|nr:pyruvate kinase [Desulfosarcinaceae bacterium]
MPKTKVVCTIGPASERPETLRDLIQAGMNVARLNFSHGTHLEHKEKIARLRELSQELKRPIAILQDLCGPKIRVGNIPAPGLELKPGHTLVLTTKEMVAEGNKVHVSYKNLPNDVRIGDRLLLADGLMDIVVRKIWGMEVSCDVITGGVLTSNKGINMPTGTLKAPSLTEKDKADLIFGLGCEVDYVALSFVRSAADIKEIKAIIKRQGKATPVIAKIEKHEAVENIDEILKVTDGIMVARGDLGVEIPLDRVPYIQKKLVRKANQAGKPVIIATQMLRSMVESPRPTRAEAADVANGVLDGADAIMLSEETASGDYPVLAVEFMVRIANSAEAHYPHEKYLAMFKAASVSKSVAHAACTLAEQLDAVAIVATTRSGATAKHISRFRPSAPIVALSPDPQAVRELCLYWGCLPSYQAVRNDNDELIDTAPRMALNTDHVAPGDRVVITAGRSTMWGKGTTDLVWVTTVKK